MRFRSGRSRSTVANATRLLALPDPVQSLLEENRISAGHARALLGLPDAGQQRNVAQRVVDEGLSVRQTEDAVKRIIRYMDEEASARVKEPAGEDPNKIYREAAAKDLSSRLARKVTIHHGVRKGKLELEYYGDEDLAALLDLFEQIKTAPKASPKAKAPEKAGGKA